MVRVFHKFNRSASVRLARAVSRLQRAGKELLAATRATPDRYHQEQLRDLVTEVRTLSNPLAGIVTSLERGEDQ
jgi:hypothetical protein